MQQQGPFALKLQTGFEVARKTDRKLLEIRGIEVP
jgi:hypothetical protein